MEKQISLTVEGLRLFGMLHLPEGEPPFPVLTLFRGFGGTHVKPSRWLARKVVASLRLDFRGSGKSEGDFRSMTLNGEIQDTKTVLAFLRSQTGVNPEPLGVLGLSMGGYMAACVVAQGPSLKALVLWAASARVARYFPHYIHTSTRAVKAGSVRGKGFRGEISFLPPFLKMGWLSQTPSPRFAPFRGKPFFCTGKQTPPFPSRSRFFKKTLEIRPWFVF